MIALGEMGLMRKDFEELTLRDFYYRLRGLEKKKIDNLHNTRLLIASFTGGDPRFILPLPGDFEDTPGQLSEEKKLRMAKKAGKLNKWGLN